MYSRWKQQRKDAQIQQQASLKQSETRFKYLSMSHCVSLLSPQLCTSDRKSVSLLFPLVPLAHFSVPRLHGRSVYCAPSITNHHIKPAPGASCRRSRGSKSDNPCVPCPPLLLLRNFSTPYSLSLPPTTTPAIFYPA
ncbi:unnamed protein product, partial [Ectocarpus sp. 12 AP-2014]